MKKFGNCYEFIKIFNPNIVGVFDNTASRLPNVTFHTVTESLRHCIVYSTDKHTGNIETRINIETNTVKTFRHERTHRKIRLTQKQIIQDKKKQHAKNQPTRSCFRLKSISMISRLKFTGFRWDNFI